MRFFALKQALRDWSVFSLNDLAMLDGTIHPRRLVEWQEKGYIQKIIRGYYRFTDNPLTEKRLFEIANTIYAPSYISCEMALSYYGLIPEAANSITSVSTRKTATFKTPVATFRYQTVSPPLLFGYTVTKDENTRRCMIATPEKALLDYLYFHTDITTTDDYKALRINEDTFHAIVHENIFFEYAARYKQKTLIKRAHELWRVIEHA